MADSRTAHLSQFVWEVFNVNRVSWPLLAFLVVTLLPSLSSSWLVYPLVLASTVILSLLALRNCDWTIRTAPLALVFVSITAAIFVGHAVAGSGDSQLALRTMGFLSVGATVLIVLPESGDLHAILGTLVVFASGLTLVGLVGLTLRGGYYSMAPGLGIRMRPLGLLVTGNPNSLGIICATGFLAYISDAGHRDWWLHGAGILALLGAILTQSRTAWLAVVAAGSIAVIYHTLGQRSMAKFLFAGGLTAIASIVVLIHPVFSLPVSFTGRLILWEGAVEAILLQPIWGYGLQDAGQVIAPHISVSKHVGQSTHNSYLRVMVAGGVLSGLAYLALHYVALKTAFQKAIQDSNATIAPLALTIGALVMQGFEAMTVFGLSTESVLMALALGIALHMPNKSIGPKTSTSLQILDSMNSVVAGTWENSASRVTAKRLCVAFKQSTIIKLVQRMVGN